MNELSDLKTIRDVIRWATTRFNEAGLYFGHGTETAWDEAATLILRSLHLPHDINPTILDARLTPSEKDHLHQLIQLRINQHIPVAYLIHEAFFAGLPFYVDERVLIPRSPIAELIESDFAPWCQSENFQDILDLCTGSGCIAIACAKTFPHAHIDAADISADALQVAQTNIDRHEVEDQVHLIQSDLFDNLPPRKYDLIVSNPPYVDAQDMSDLPNEYHHEPSLGLAAGEDGLDIVKRILRDAGNYLHEEGVLIVEVGNSEFALAEQFPEIPFTWIEFQRGGGGVFMLTASQLSESQHFLQRVV